MNKTAENPDKLLRVSEVAEQLSVTVVTVRNWINDGKLPASKPFGAWRIRAGDLQDILTTGAGENV